jgi:hypothetical protein
MAVDSGLRSGAFRLRPHRPGRTVFLVVAVAVVLTVGGWLLYDHGRRQGGHEAARARATEARLRLEIEELRARVEELSQRNTLLERADRIDRESINHLRQTIEQREARVRELEEELAFYRNLVSPSDTEPSMNVRGFSVTPAAGSERRFRYELILTQVNGGDRYVKGRVDLTLSGSNASGEASLAGGDFLVEGESATNFRFKYFQTLGGIIELPESFSPARLRLKVLPSGGRLDAVEEQFTWKSLISGGT